MTVMAKYRVKLKKRGGRHGIGPDRRMHLNHLGKPKKRLSVGAAHRLADATGMRAFKCPCCGGWHVGRTDEQWREDAGTARRR